MPGVEFAPQLADDVRGTHPIPHVPHLRCSLCHIDHMVMDLQCPITQSASPQPSPAGEEPQECVAAG